MKKLLFIILGVLPFMSCSDWLSLQPVDSLNDITYYKTPAQAFEALTGAYSVLTQDGSANIIMASEIASDNCFTGGGKNDSDPDIDVFRKTVDMCNAEWKKYYTGISRTNTLISKLDGVNWGKTPELRKVYESEARFLRAYYYFDLVRMFGNVPLIKKPLTNNYNVEQALPDSVYKLIAEDLKFASANLPSTPYASITDANRGRATKWAAESLLARVYLYYTGYYKKSDLVGVVTKADALAAVEDVIASSGHDLLPSFKALWQDDYTNYNKNNKEYVFAIKYSSAGKGDWNLNYGNRFQVMVSLRGQSLGNYQNGWGLATVNPKLWNSYDPTDTRRSATIISVTDEKLNYDPTDQRHYTTYFWKKYTRIKAFDCTLKGGDFQIDNDADYVIIRYSDVLLMAAELGSANAKVYLNKVRDRAYGNSDAGHQVDATPANIAKERYLEFALEGQRYWDLLRQGMDVAKAAIDNAASGNMPAITFRTETQGLFPIPDSQINLSGGTLKQNPGW